LNAIDRIPIGLAHPWNLIWIKSDLYFGLRRSCGQTKIAFETITLTDFDSECGETVEQ
jgi:hypothetical protein